MKNIKMKKKIKIIIIIIFAISLLFLNNVYAIDTIDDIIDSADNFLTKRKFNRRNNKRIKFKANI